MSHSMLTHAANKSSDSSVHDRIQIALAIADPNILKSLLVNCTPPIAHPHVVGAVTSEIGIPIESKKVADGLLCFEAIRCVLASPHAHIELNETTHTSSREQQRHYSQLTQCESETQTLGQNVTVAQGLALLTHSGFAPRQSEAILNLPYEACYKSWWQTLDDYGNLSVPFLRLIRTIRYPNGTLTLRYKDYFSQEKPTCFKSQEHKVLVEIQKKVQHFSKTLKKINHSREKLGISNAILICDRISDLESRGFISQGISIYAAQDFALPAEANCVTCANRDCPMNGISNSPVMICRRFCLEDWHE